jgi:H+/Cl- antiporter ClcA
MSAALGGTMRSPLTSTIFALELTQDVNVLPALLIASVVTHGLTVLVMKQSILTEKVAAAAITSAASTPSTPWSGSASAR